MASYYFYGNARLIDAVEGRLADAGFARSDELDGCELVITFCTNMTELEDLYFGDGGLVEQLDAGSVAVDLSPATPNLAGEISGVSAVSDITYVAAPMNVLDKLSEDAFARENLSCIAGAESGSITAARDLLDALFGEVKEAQSAYAAQLENITVIIQQVSQMTAAAEAYSLFQAQKHSPTGIGSLTRAAEAIPEGGSTMLEAIKAKRFAGSYTVEMLMAELSSAMMTADDCDAILPQTETAFHLYELLAIIGGSDMSPAALALVYEGEDAEWNSEYGLDWHRIEHLYDGHGHDHDDYDDYEALEGIEGLEPLDGYDGLDMDEFMDDFNGDDDPYDDDDFTSGFGYSVN